MLTLVRIQLGPPHFLRFNMQSLVETNLHVELVFKLVCPCSSVVEHTLGKGEVTSSILVTGFGLNPFVDIRSIYPLKQKSSIPIVLALCWSLRTEF